MKTAAHYKEREICSLLSQRLDGHTYHSSGEPDDDGTDDLLYMDIGEYQSREVEEQLEERTREAKENGLSSSGEREIAPPTSEI